MREQLPFLRGTDFSLCKRKAGQLFAAALFICLTIPSFASTSFAGDANYFSKKTNHLKDKIFESAAYQAMLMPCPGGSGVVGGRVIGDYNFNGQDDEIGGVRGVTVSLYSCDPDGNSTLVGTTLTDYDGHYFFDGLADGTSYKVEFEADPVLSPGFIGGDFGSDVQFVTAPTCGVNTAFAGAEDYTDENPILYSTCFINGDPLAAGANGADEDVLVSFTWDSRGSSTPPNKIGTAAQYGSIYGIAQDRFDDYLFTSAFIKRHVGMGPEGIGGIYVLDISGTPTPLFSFDLADMGINVGTIASNSARGLQPSVNLPSNDPDAYPMVAKNGIGAMEVDYLGENLYVVNLFERKLHKIDITGLPTPPTSSDVTTYNLPTSSCTGGEYRPFAVRFFRGEVYVGSVCDASISQNSADLTASIHRLDGTTFNAITTFSLNYTKGYTTLHSSCEDFPGWYPWTDMVPAACDNGSTIVYPQPVFSDFEFDVDGSLIVGLMDRIGHQLGYENYKPTGTDLVSTVSGGDLLRLYLEDDGTYTLENNGTAGPVSTGGAGNGQGPGGGEFYFNDVFEGGLNNLTPAPHAETSQGAIAFNRGTGDIATTALDPYSIAFNTGGINWLSNAEAEIRDQEGYRLYRTSGSNNSTFAKANGLGDLMTDYALAPIQIGGMAWVDANDDGIQDGCEDVLMGIEVSLFDENGSLISTIVTNANGEYYFNDGDIEENTKYFVVFGTDGEFNTVSGQINNAYFITADDEGTGSNPDKNDSDIISASAGMGNGSFTGMPFIMLTTGGSGYVDHSFDAGFTPEGFIAPPVAGLGDYVWEDLNGDGIQDSNEPPISGVTVTLLDGNGNVVLTTMTDGNGNYSFPGVMAGTYCIQFGTPTGFNGTLQNTGNGTNDSDANAGTGKTANFVFDPLDGDDLNFDAGFVKIPATAGLGDYVWEDLNGDGIQDSNEPPISGVTVQLLDGNGNVIATTMTNASGNYFFPGIGAGTYCIQFGTPTGFNGTLQNTGNGANDSDANSSTGKTGNFVFDPENGDDFTFDAGFVRIPVPAGVGDFVWEDLDGNGVQDPGEPGIPGVTVNLVDGNGNIISTTMTDGNGNYFFPDVPAGTYCIQFVGPTGFVGTAQNAGNGANDSSADPTTGKGGTFTFDPADGDNLTQDAGFVRVPLNCTGAEITGATVTPSCGPIGGTVTINISGDAAQYDRIWIPNRGTQGADLNSRNDLPQGTYLVILQHIGDPDCNDKQYFTINEDCGFFPDTTIVSLKIGETKDFCLSTEGFEGDVASTKMDCISGCEVLTTSQVESTDHCISLEGKRQGTQELYFEACDANGNCTKSILIIEVKRSTPTEGPTAVADIYEMVGSDPMTFDVCLNDIFDGELNSLSIIHNPSNGIATKNEDNTITYEPNGIHCEDEFTYEICNDDGCDISSVKLIIECEGIKPVSGFSPNRDGINDQFQVIGIDKYENELTVFNRWGNVVYNKKQYNNDWEGEFNGVALPTGVYFYLINYDGGKTMTGYVVINQ